MENNYYEMSEVDTLEVVRKKQTLQRKLLFIFLFISDIVATYKLLDAFPSSLSRQFGLAACLFFINALLILWMKYLIHQPEEVQKQILFRIAGETMIDCSLYDIINNRWSRLRKAQILYIEIIFSAVALILTAWMAFLDFATENANILLEFKNAFTVNLLPYYVGFCLSAIAIITMAFIQNNKNDVIWPLRKEFMIKLIQVVFIGVFYDNGGPAFALIAFTAFFRLYNIAKA